MIANDLSGYEQFTTRVEDVAPESPTVVEPIDTDSGPDDRRGVGYVFGDDLKFAISAAMTLGRPLLVTGEPGSGKTELGYAIARNLPDRPIVRHFTCKSASEGKDLFYTYDALARFHAVQTASVAARQGRSQAAGSSAEPFIRYAALGQALLDAWGLKTVTARGPSTKKRRSVVIIDEIDKASRDFCNDVLDQLDTLSFEVPELMREEEVGRTLPGAKLTRNLRPIVVIASNSEKLLPEPFLRRCVYHSIAPPSEETLQVIVQERILREFDGTWTDHRVANAVSRVRAVFLALRKEGLSKPPGTAELVDATIVAVAYALKKSSSPADIMHIVLPTLVKDATDLDAARRMIATGRMGKV